MAEPPEIDELAKRYLDLWQEHLSGMAADPEWGAAMTRLFAAFVSPAMGPGAMPPGINPEPGETGHGASEIVTKRTATAADAPADSGDELHELQRRVAVLEERIAQLEGRKGQD